MIMTGDRKKAITAILGPDSPNVGMKGDASYPEKPDEMDMSKHLAQEVIECIHNKDIQGFLDGLRALFQEFDSKPHEEGVHVKL